MRMLHGWTTPGTLRDKMNESTLNEDRLTDTYLPNDRYGAVEALIMKEAPAFAGPFLEPQDIEEFLPLRLIGAPIDGCIRNLTHDFPDGPTYWVLIRTAVPNAMIAKFGTFQCVVIGMALPLAVVGLATNLLRWEPLRRYLLEGVSPPAEQAPVRVTRSEAVQRLIDRAAAWDDETGALASTLNFMTLYLLTAHELGHLALGHLDRTGVRGGFIEESPAAGTDLIEARESRALEWDADIFAAAATIWWTGVPGVREDWKDVLTDKPAGLRLFFVGAYVFFSVMDRVSKSSTPDPLRTHPAPMVRITLMIMGAAQVLQALGGFTADEAQNEARAAIRAVEIALNELEGGMMDRTEAAALQEALDISVEECTTTLASLIPGLSRHRLSGLFWAGSLG